MSGIRYVALVSPLAFGTPLEEWTEPTGDLLRLIPCGRDLTGDRVPDVLVRASNATGDRLVILSGTDLSLAKEFDGVLVFDGVATKPRVGAATVIGDVNDDGQADILYGWVPVGFADHTGTAYLYTGGESLGTTYCHSATANSTGQASKIQAIGSDLVSDQWMTLAVSDLPPGQFGFFLTSQTTGFTPFASGSQGHLCLAGSIGRYNAPDEIRSWGAEGFTALEMELATMPTPTVPVPLLAGEDWSFQLWHRESGGHSNFSTAVTVDWK